jgi:hypothetical protein
MMRTAVVLTGLLGLLAACDPSAPRAGAGPAVDNFQPGESRWLYGIDPGDDVDCAFGSRRPGNLVCGFTRDGRERTAEITIDEVPITADADLPVGDPAFWQGVVTDMERQAQAISDPRVTRLGAEIQGPPRPPVRAADACVRFRVDRRQGNTFIDNEGARCVFFDPETRIADYVLVELVDRRSGLPRAPGFSRDADALIASLNHKPKPSTP